jgi:hypothetical protein
VAWWGNPFAALVPKAYELPGLAVASVLGYVLAGMASPYRSELFGARRERLLPRVAILAGAGQLLVTISAIWIDAYARALGGISYALVLWLGYRQYREAIYTDEPADEAVSR